jgi:hypothetical protein
MGYALDANNLCVPLRMFYIIKLQRILGQDISILTKLK